MEWTLGLGVLASLAAALLIGLAKLLLRKRAERKLDAAMAEDSTLQSLRDSVTRLDEALHPILTPAREAGDATANTAVQKWKNGLSVAISHLQFTVPDLPQRPGLDLDLVDRIERMEQMADEAVKELGQQAGLCGQHMGPQDRERRTCSARHDRVSATHGSQDAAHHAWSAHTTAFSGTHTVTAHNGGQLFGVHRPKG